MYSKLCLLCLGIFLLYGCGRSMPTNYYLLESSLGAIQVDRMPKKTLRVAQVEIPSYLNRNNIVSRVKGESSLILAEFHLWAEPVSAGIRRVMEETLLQPALDANINVLPSGTASGGDYILLLDVQRFDGNFNAPAVLECRWTVLDREERPIQSGLYSSEAMVQGADYNILVQTESRLLREMGEKLGALIPNIINTHSR